MKFLLHTIASLLVTFGSTGILQGQELIQKSTPTLEPPTTTSGQVNLFETADSKWFVLKQDKPNGSQKNQPKDIYVFPDADKRFRRYVKNTVGPLSLLKSAAGAGLSHWDKDPVEWEQGAEGYGKRLASNIGSNAIRQTVTYGLSEAMRLDTGFEKSRRKGFWPRLSDALAQNVTSRTRSGKRVISVPIFAGAYAGSIIPAETWYPSRYTYKDGLRSGSYSFAAGFAMNVVREFFFNW
jgi:hypothetical protein